MSAADFATVLHPAIAVFIVFPIIGMVVNFAWQTRQRRLQAATGGKSKIPPIVGPEHLKLGRWLTGAVVGITLLGIGQPLFKKLILEQHWRDDTARFGLIILFFVVTIASLVLLYRAQQRVWRAIFATLTGMGIVILGMQPEIFRRGFEWYVSHYYYGVTAALLMIFSLAIVQDIYQDRNNRWRNVHVALNCIALLLFMGQGMTGARDLLEISLSWQKPYIEQLYIQNCQAQPCVVQPAAPAPPPGS